MSTAPTAPTYSMARTNARRRALLADPAVRAALAGSGLGSVGTNPARRTATPVTGLVPDHVKRMHKNRRPGSDKGQGEWRTVSPSYRDAVTVDARWSK